MLDWKKPENLRADYVPPLVQNNVLKPASFWHMAVHNARMDVLKKKKELEEAVEYFEHAQKMLDRSLPKRLP